MSMAREETSIPETEVTRRKHFLQIDAVKVIAIAFVVLDHMLTTGLHDTLIASFWERLAMPFFLIVMGFNMGHSFRYRGTTKLRELYSLQYFWRKIKRYVLPFVLLYAVSILLGIYFDALEPSRWWYLAFLPFWGPGNWFIPVLFTSILIFPAVYKAYTMSPRITVALCLLSEILLSLVLFFNTPLVPSDGTYVYTGLDAISLMWIIRLNILFYLPAVAFGLWFSDGHDITQKRNWFMWLAAPLSIIYIYAYTFFGFRFEIFDGVHLRRLIWGDYTLLVYPYAAFLILLAMRYLPSDSQGLGSRLVMRISRATYHIFLFQMMYYAVWFQLNPYYSSTGFGSALHLYLPFYLLSLAICIVGGILWYEGERRIGSIWKFRSESKMK
ncbi:MAG: acyltransferase [Candidatus Hermodarchaeota archaeon]